MKKLYVVGNKTSKSLSPLIFNYWFNKYKIKAEYGFLELNNNNFHKKITETLKDKNILGFNITIPYKQKIMKYINAFDTHSKKINAVNCVSTNKKIKGYNTDWCGYYNTLPIKKNFNHKSVVLIGYGGAALAIHYALIRNNFKNILVFNRTKKKLRFEKKTKYTLSMDGLEQYLEGADLIINTTPTNPITKKNISKIKKTTLLSEIVYLPKETGFLKKFPNNKKIYGISMLLEQAIPCFKIWFGFMPTVDKKLIDLLDKKIK